MIRIDNISKSYGGQSILDDISFLLGKGERCALVGRNGCGKTTLFKIMAGLESADGGEVVMPKEYRTGYLQQHLDFSQATVVDEAALGLRDPDERYKAEALLSGLGFTAEELEKSPGEFSGGYQLRIHLAKVLASEPDCLLLDEPTNYLDVVAIRWFERFLRNWQGEALLISHDRQFLDNISTHTAGIHRHKLIKVKGGTTPYYEQLLAREEVYERTRSNVDKKRTHHEDFIRRFGAKATKAKQAESRKKMLGRLPVLDKLNALQSLDFRFHEAPLPGKQVLKAWNVGFRYPQMEQPLIDGVSVEVLKGDRMAILGKNGRGKSTMLALIAGELTPEAGKIKPSESCRIGYFGQTNIERLDPNITVEEAIHRANPELRQGEVRGLCGIMQFPQDHMKKRIDVLSGGEKARVLLGCILATPCNLLLLDEPSNHLDIESVEALQCALEEFSGAVVIVSHSEEILRRLPNKMIVCREKGQELILGNYDEFLKKGGWENEVQLKEAPPRKLDRRRRAELIQERARATKSFEKQMRSIEHKIETFEAKVDKAQGQLEEAETSDIPALSRTIGEAQKAIELLFAELEAIDLECQAVRAPFDEQLG